MEKDTIKKNSERPTKKLGELLLEQSVITDEILKEVLSEQRVTHQRLGEILVERGFATAEQINRALASQMETEAVRISDYIILPEVVSLFDEEDARKLQAMPLFKSEDMLYVAMKNPNDITRIRNNNFILVSEIFVEKSD